jgi:RNA polymerase sigma factor (sigma-70 family)
MIELIGSTMDDVHAAVPTTRAASDDLFVAEAFEAHRRELYGFLRRATNDATAAEDLLQEAFLRLTKETRAGHRPDHVRAWLYQVAAHLAVSRGRRASVALRWLRGLASTPIATPFNPPEAGLLAHDRVSSIERGLLRLGPDARAALLMAGHGFSGAEIALAIGRSEAATRTLMSRSRVRLRGILDGAEDDR